MIPFAVVGSERTVIIDGKPVRGRKNRWGVVNVEDERHCEFVYLRNFLTRFVPFLYPALRCTIFTSCLRVQDTPPGPHRDDGADPLRGLPVKTAPRAQGADQRAPVRRGAVNGAARAKCPCPVVAPSRARGARRDTPPRLGVFSVGFRSPRFASHLPLRLRRLRCGPERSLLMMPPLSPSPSPVLGCAGWLVGWSVDWTSVLCLSPFAPSLLCLPPLCPTLVYNSILSRSCRSDTRLRARKLKSQGSRFNVWCAGAARASRIPLPLPLE